MNKPRHTPPATDNHDEIGAMLLSLSGHGETDGRTWRELEVMVEGRVVDAEWRAVGLINNILDRMVEANK